MYESCVWEFHCKSEADREKAKEFCLHEGVHYDFSSPFYRQWITCYYNGVEADVLGQLVRLCLRFYSSYGYFYLFMEGPQYVVLRDKEMESKVLKDLREALVEYYRQKKDSSAYEAIKKRFYKVDFFYFRLADRMAHVELSKDRGSKIVSAWDLRDKTYVSRGPSRRVKPWTEIWLPLILRDLPPEEWDSVLKGALRPRKTR